MNIALWIIRYLATSVLSITIFVSFLTFMLASHFTNKLLDETFYIHILEENDTYERIYDEVLADPGIKRYTGSLTSQLQIINHQDLVALSRQIAPPDYLQEQVEDNIVRAVGYFDGRQADLEVFIDLTEPLERIKPNVFSFIDQRIDGLETIGVNPNLSLVDQLIEVEQLTRAAVFDLATGNTPDAIPSIDIIPFEYRDEVFDQGVVTVLNDSRLDPRVRQGLRDNLPAVREQFIAGDTREFLKESVHAGLTPLIDQSLTQARRSLDEQDRLDLLAVLVRSDPNLTEQSLHADLENARLQIERVKFWGKTVALLVALGAMVVLVLIYLPSLTNILRWPGLVLIFNGVMLFVAAKILEKMLPDQLTPVIRDSLKNSPDIPLSAVALLGDLAQSFNQQIFTSMATPALFLLMVGLLMLGVSFLVVFLKPLVPGIH